jgi:hypothetical protein
MVFLPFTVFHYKPSKTTLTAEKACNGFSAFRRFSLQSPKKDIKAAPETASGSQKQ